ncbi:MRG family protein, putative isoform 1 [Hibiscus syriacus]|uniref:MRG family protein, putative isoform 1 n=1 Tax=Hibiscus syriacus TaxID=106335 RepID=A0A6A2YTY0_HIBSY|nr:MRG family protein, putative isoform 1 [Hibiscus syriacus]
MANSFCFVLVLLLASFIFTSEARPLNDAVPSSRSSITKGMEVLLDDLSLAIEGIKTGGKGHAFVDTVTNSGPSSGGQGNALVDAVINSGPSSGGQGNALVDAVTNSGPSSGGDGH